MLIQLIVGIRLKLGILYYWNFNEYYSVIEVDTTINFIGLQTLFHNNGIRDTLSASLMNQIFPVG